MVASRVEAWIEIPSTRTRHPEPLVASRVEAWIEIPRSRKALATPMVASRVEAWIEIFLNFSFIISELSPPAWRRGLKYG